MKRQDGFTLIELMVVMGLMILISSIVVSGTFGMTRSSSYRVAEDIVFNTLQMARQRACTDGKRVIVAFMVDRSDNYEDNALSIIEATGTITEEVTENYIQDRCATLSKYTGSGVRVSGESTNTVWNLRTGAKFTGFTLTITPIEGVPLPGRNNDSYSYSVSQIRPKGGFDRTFWAKGDPYGFQVGQSQTLPKGMKIGFGTVGTSPNDKLLVFEPDGTGFVGVAAARGIQENGLEADLCLYEEIFKSDAKKARHVLFKKGIVSVK